MTLSPLLKSYGPLLRLVVLGSLVLLFARTFGPELARRFAPEVAFDTAVAIESVEGAVAGKPALVPASNPTPIRHVVARGDTWYSIAKHYQIPDYNALARHFQFVTLREGMTLEIPETLREAP